MILIPVVTQINAVRPERDEMIDLVTREWTQDELIAYAGRFGHWFDPGTGWDYSSTNYFLLGVIAERATDRSLASLLRDRVFDPASATSTWLHEYEATRGQRGTGYLGFVEGWPHSEMFGDLAIFTKGKRRRALDMSSRLETPTVMAMSATL